MRLGVEAAVIEGRFTPGDVDVVDGRIVRLGLAHRHGTGSPSPASSTSRSTASAASTSSRPSGGLSPGRRGAARDGRHGLPADADHEPRGGAARRAREVPAPGGDDRPRVLGVHLEGPFLSPRRLGAHVASARRDPDLALLDRLLDGGPVRLMTLAPELPGRRCAHRPALRARRVVSLGHSDASAGQANAAFDRGVRTVTHVFNAMAPLHHRNPGLSAPPSRATTWSCR